MSDAPALPNPSSEFLLRLGQYPDTPTRELLEPYLSYELWLRKAFKRDGTTLDGLANLVPVYRGHQDSFRVRNIDRQIADKSKYIMLLPKDEESVNGHLAITTSLEEYNNNFNAFTHGKSKFDSSLEHQWRIQGLTCTGVLNNLGVSNKPQI
jgi:hypothetical protein